MNVFSVLKPQNLEKTADAAKKAVISWKKMPVQSPDMIPYKIFEGFKLKNKTIGDIFVSTIKANGENRHKIIVNNRFGSEVGFEEFDINPRNKNIFGYSIKVKHGLRRKGTGLGELMRLASVMEMMENNSERIGIYSKDTAVYFHAKYKFRPDIYKFEERDYAILTVMNDTSRNFADLAAEAKEIFKQIKLTQDDAEAQRNLCKTVNDITHRYIQRALQNPDPSKSHPFNWGMNMILKKSDVIENKEFFNALFEKHGIDYKI